MPGSPSVMRFMPKKGKNIGDTKDIGIKVRSSMLDLMLAPDLLPSQHQRRHQARVNSGSPDPPVPRHPNLTFFSARKIPRLIPELDGIIRLASGSAPTCLHKTGSDPVLTSRSGPETLYGPACLASRCTPPRTAAGCGIMELPNPSQRGQRRSRQRGPHRHTPIMSNYTRNWTGGAANSSFLLKRAGWARLPSLHLPLLSSSADGSLGREKEFKEGKGGAAPTHGRVNPWVGWCCPNPTCDFEMEMPITMSVNRNKDTNSVFVVRGLEMFTLGPAPRVSSQGMPIPQGDGRPRLALDPLRQVREPAGRPAQSKGVQWNRNKVPGARGRQGTRTISATTAPAACFESLTSLPICQPTTDVAWRAVRLRHPNLTACKRSVTPIRTGAATFAAQSVDRRTRTGLL
ncbi:hypothetical protein Hte_008799 [Hypoxylon texense]